MARIYWTSQVREIRAFIARDAPIAASPFARRLREAVGRLQEFPESGQVVSELGREDIREILRGNYRIIYRFRNNRVDILAVFHSARLLGDDLF